MLNYLARLGWSHGDDELFTTRPDWCSWFDGSTPGNKSPAQWDAAKLAWVNAQYIKQADDKRLATLVAGATVPARGVDVKDARPRSHRCRGACSRTAAATDGRTGRLVVRCYFVPVAAQRGRPGGACHRRRSSRRCEALARASLANVDWDKAALSQQAIKDTHRPSTS